MSRIFLAQAINRVCLTQIGPWDVDELPDEWIDAVQALASGNRNLQAGLARVEEIKSRWRREMGYVH